MGWDCFRARRSPTRGVREGLGNTGQGEFLKRTCPGKSTRKQFCGGLGSCHRHRLQFPSPFVIFPDADRTVCKFPVIFL